jgi:hypothetical protein|tara:strand:+ start:474 stop:692 length:219 start_codon:yes stop_codon:yes gene_type:complete
MDPHVMAGWIATVFAGMSLAGTAIWYFATLWTMVKAIKDNFNSHVNDCDNHRNEIDKTLAKHGIRLTKLESQ